MKQLFWVAAAAIALSTVSSAEARAQVAIPAAAVAGAPAQYKTGGFALGVHAFTFVKFTAFEAIEKTAASGAKCIDLRPGQKLAPDDATPVGPGMGADKTKKLKDKVAASGLKLMGFGVVPIPRDEARARVLFEWAHEMGISVFNTESTDALDTAEKLAREFDINVGIHDHPRRPNDPKYRLWDPSYVLSLVKERDHHIGACADVGHWARSGLRPVDCLKILSGRIVSSHFKDLNVRGVVSAHDVPWGTGSSEAAAMLDELHAQNFQGPLSVEYETNMEHSLPEVAQCIAFVRGYGMARGY